MPRAAKPAGGITIGFLGTGAMEVNKATTALEEFINESVKPDEPARFIFPLTTDEFTDSMKELALMAKASRISYEVITQADDKGRRAHQEIAAAAAKQYQVTDVWTQMEAILVEAPSAALAVLWDEKRDAELDGLAVKFMDAGIEVRDLINGMIILGEQDESQEGEGPVAEPVEVVEEGEEETDDEEGNAEDAVEIINVTTSDLHTRAEMERMSHAEVKEIAVSLGLPVRKARENMIVAILEKEGGFQEVADTPVGSSAVLEAIAAPPVDMGVLEEILDRFGARFFTGLDEWTTRFLGGLEGIQFNLKPEEPMDMNEPEPQPEPTPVRRRLVRQS